MHYLFVQGGEFTADEAEGGAGGAGLEDQAADDREGDQEPNTSQQPGRDRQTYRHTDTHID